MELYFDSNGNAVSEMQHSAEKCGGRKFMSFKAFSAALGASGTASRVSKCGDPEPPGRMGF
jgi:hypothetical protein